VASPLQRDEDGAAAPAEIDNLRKAIENSNVIVTPEYNHGIPGVLKNALDWASRPYGKSCLVNKPVLVISISPAFTGGVRSRAGR
jgi:chromate reductase